MRVSIRKTVVAAVAALGMVMAATISTPAEAQFHGGGFYGGGFHGGGFHGGGWGGGWHGGGWRGGGWGRPGWGGGWGWGRAGWGGGCWNCGGWGWGGWGGFPASTASEPIIVGASAPVIINIGVDPTQGDAIGRSSGGCVIHKLNYDSNGKYVGERQIPLC